MRKALLVFFTLFCGLFLHGQSIDPLQLKREIANLNDQHQYDKSILYLEEILSSEDATAYDHFHVYVQKSLTYKRLFNYTVALNNLDLALLEAERDSLHADEIKSRVLIERLFIYFDLQRYDEFDKLLEMITPKHLQHVDQETVAIYTSILGILAMREGHYEEAEVQLNRAIALLQKESPKDLPNVYRVKVALYGKMGRHADAIEAYEKGLAYAEQYKMDLYRIIMYETITTYYKDLGDYKNAFHYQLKVSETRTKYNANNVSGVLTELEKELLQQRKNMEVEYEKSYKTYLLIIGGILLLLIITLVRLLIVSLQKRVLVERENNHIRSEIEKLTNERNELGIKRIDIASVGLTERQQEIIQLVQQGMTNKQIGDTLFISENTVKYHLKQIYEILGVESRTDLKRSTL